MPSVREIRALPSKPISSRTRARLGPLSTTEPIKTQLGAIKTHLASGLKAATGRAAPYAKTDRPTTSSGYKRSRSDGYDAKAAGKGADTVAYAHLSDYARATKLARSTGRSDTGAARTFLDDAKQLVEEGRAAKRDRLRTLRGPGAVNRATSSLAYLSRVGSAAERFLALNRAERETADDLKDEHDAARQKRARIRAKAKNIYERAMSTIRQVNESTERHARGPPRSSTSVQGESSAEPSRKRRPLFSPVRPVQAVSASDTSRRTTSKPLATAVDRPTSIRHASVRTVADPVAQRARKPVVASPYARPDKPKSKPIEGNLLFQATANILKKTNAAPRQKQHAELGLGPAPALPPVKSKRSTPAPFDNNSVRSGGKQASLRPREQDVKSVKASSGSRPASSAAATAPQSVKASSSRPASSSLRSKPATSTLATSRSTSSTSLSTAASSAVASATSASSRSSPKNISRRSSGENDTPMAGVAGELETALRRHIASLRSMTIREEAIVVPLLREACAATVTCQDAALVREVLEAALFIGGSASSVAMATHLTKLLPQDPTSHDFLGRSGMQNILRFLDRSQATLLEKYTAMLRPIKPTIEAFEAALALCKVETALASDIEKRLRRASKLRDAMTAALEHSPVPELDASLLASFEPGPIPTNVARSATSGSRSTSSARSASASSHSAAVEAITSGRSSRSASSGSNSDISAATDVLEDLDTSIRRKIAVLSVCTEEDLAEALPIAEKACQMALRSRAADVVLGVVRETLRLGQCDSLRNATVHLVRLAPLWPESHELMGKLHIEEAKSEVGPDESFTSRAQYDLALTLVALAIGNFDRAITLSRAGSAEHSRVWKERRDAQLARRNLRNALDDSQLPELSN